MSFVTIGSLVVIAVAVPRDYLTEGRFGPTVWERVIAGMGQNRLSPRPKAVIILASLRPKTMSREERMSEPTRSTLSVILPNYNHGRLLGRAVTALLSQERRPEEIIIIDDGSTDDSLSVVSEFLSSSRVQLLVNETNKGVTFSLTRGFEASSGKYVYFAAADDWVLPGFFATAVRLLERYPEAGLACGEAILVCGCTGKSLGMRPAVEPSARVAYLPPEAVAAMLKTSDNWILTGSTIFVRERVLAAGGFLSDLGSFADGYLARKLALMHGFCYIPRPLAVWQVFDNSFSRETTSNPARAEQVLACALVQIDKDPTFPRWYSECFRRRWLFAIARSAVVANSINSAVLSSVFAASRFDQIVLSVLSWFRPTAVIRPLLLAWLWFRLMPMSLGTLTLTYFRRRFRRINGESRLIEGHRFGFFAPRSRC